MASGAELEYDDRTPPALSQEDAAYERWYRVLAAWDEGSLAYEQSGEWQRLEALVQETAAELDSLVDESPQEADVLLSLLFLLRPPFAQPTSLKPFELLAMNANKLGEWQQRAGIQLAVSYVPLLAHEEALITPDDARRACVGALLREGNVKEAGQVLGACDPAHPLSQAQAVVCDYLEECGEPDPISVLAGFEDEELASDAAVFLADAEDARGNVQLAFELLRNVIAWTPANSERFGQRQRLRETYARLARRSGDPTWASAIRTWYGWPAEFDLTAWAAETLAWAEADEQYELSPERLGGTLPLILPAS